MFDDLPEYNRMIRLSRMEGFEQGKKEGKKIVQSDEAEFLSALLDGDFGSSYEDIIDALKFRIKCLMEM